MKGKINAFCKIHGRLFEKSGFLYCEAVTKAAFPSACQCALGKGAGLRWRPLPQAEAPTEPAGEKAVRQSALTEGAWPRAEGRADSCHNKTRICRVPSYKQENTRFRAGVALSFRDLLLARCTVCRYPIPFGAPWPLALGVSPAVLGSRLGRCFASRGVHWTPATRSALFPAAKVSTGDPRPIIPNSAFRIPN